MAKEMDVKGLNISKHFSKLITKMHHVNCPLKSCESPRILKNSIAKTAELDNIC
jgi:hypothetical protein